MPTNTMSVRIIPERFAVANATQAHPKAFASITNLDSITVIIEERFAELSQEKILGWKLCSFLETNELNEHVKTTLRTAFPCLWLSVSGQDYVLIQEINLASAHNMFTSWGWKTIT